MNINQHVVKRDRGWAVIGEGNQRDTVVLPTQEAAIAKARAIAHNQGGGLIIHARQRSNQGQPMQFRNTANK